MSFIYVVLHSLHTVCFRLPLQSPGGLCGVIVDVYYSCWWRKETNWKARCCRESTARTWTCPPPSLYLVQSLLGLSSATGSVRAVVLKWALGRLQWLSQSHLFEPWGASFPWTQPLLMTADYILPAVTGQLWIGVQPNHLGFSFLPSESLPLVRCCEILGGKRYTRRNGVCLFCFPFKERQKISETELGDQGPLVTSLNVFSCNYDGNFLREPLNHK